jgi:hypothetical protein
VEVRTKSALHSLTTALMLGVLLCGCCSQAGLEITFLPGGYMRISKPK